MTSTSEIDAEVRQAERALYSAMTSRDRAALARLLAPDLAYVHSTAVSETRAQYLAGVEEGLYEYASVSSRGTRVRGDGAFAMIDGVCDMEVGARGGPKALIHLLFVLVWRRTADGWKLVHRHATRMPAQ